MVRTTEVNDKVTCQSRKGCDLYQNDSINGEQPTKVADMSAIRNTSELKSASGDISHDFCKRIFPTSNLNKVNISTIM